MVERGMPNCRAVSARQFGIPRSTIHDRLSGRVSVSNPSAGKQIVFPKAAKEKLASSIKEAVSMGVGLSKQQIIAKAAKLARTMRLKTLVLKTAYLVKTGQMAF